MGQKPHLSLYFFYSCPFCQRVLNIINQLAIEVDLKDIHQDRMAFDKLVKDTGRKTVPCLYIDDKPMHESDDIISWLTQNQNNLPKKS